MRVWREGTNNTYCIFINGLFSKSHIQSIITIIGNFNFFDFEGIASFATTSTRQVTDDLETRPGCPGGTGCTGITTDNVVTSKGFAALAFKWNPIYGKITWLNKSIVPFDLNFNAGFGMTSTTEDEMEPTIHFGTSQVFALSKGMAFRWDLIWNMYQATATDDLGAKETLSQNDLFLGIGMSFYFPEATYRWNA